MTFVSRQKPSLSEIYRCVWDVLTREHRRPQVVDIAATFLMTECEMRKYLSEQRWPSARQIISYTHAAYPALLVSHGMKIDAAMSLAGYANRTNFGRQFCAFFGCAPSQAKGRPLRIPHIPPDCLAALRRAMEAENEPARETVGVC